MRIALSVFVITFLIFISNDLKSADHYDAMNLDQVAHAFGWNF